MNLFQIIIFIGLIGNTVLGLFVLLSNPKRAANIGFFSLTLSMMLWLGSMFFCSYQHSPRMLLFWIRQTSMFAGLIPLGVSILKLTIVHDSLSLRRGFYELRYWLLVSFSIIILCHSSVFVLSASNPTASELVPPTEYGWGFIVYMAFFIGAIINFIFSFWRIAKGRGGAQKTEIQFLQLGCVASFIIGVFLIAFAEILGDQELSLFVPLSVLALDGFVAYGIATRRILAAPEVLQRVVSYLLMCLYLSVLYICAEWVGSHIFRWFVIDTTYFSGLLAALVVAFSVVPAQRWMQRFSYHLFSSSHQFDVDQVLEEAGHVFQEVSTDETLMALFSGFIIRAFQTTRVVLLKVGADGVFRHHYAFPEWGEKTDLSLSSQSSLVELVRRDAEPFTEDTLERMRPSILVNGARRDMRALGASVAVGSFTHKKLQMVVLLYPKTSRAIYDLREQKALQLVCNQLAVALENANLYTAVQNGKIYNEILLDSLTSGIVAVDDARQVTVFNQRAQTITHLPVEDIVNESMEQLPAALTEIVEKILTTGAGVRDYDTFIDTGEDRVPVRVSGSAFHGHTGKHLGALLVFSDMTLLRKMEERIRRTDRLSSIGTLSAGMAHEIRNPLVTIKTFTELLPEQYGNQEFRETFFDLVDQEVQRIDAIVNRLLNFARPAKASLKPVYLHDIIENSIRLVEQQVINNKIQLQTNLAAEHHLILADAEQINQTLVNFFLNAIQAMDLGGTLSVETMLNKSAICIDVRDTGCGLSEEHEKHIFDPFFTTKESGVGLGLSVSHGIIQEHQGTIHVDSEPGKGTVFHVELPLIDEKEI
ncbi:ATP-binding protein [Tichowtungia aerotolerans]|uniref:histidine kinase n=1 Tax=Tichowtungia aerotolerans TaxID=2697043 RepID=A0A6P1MAS4_9BACT|nr:ATP-binding protein [Tichowtungia aerotolerans]QHI69654.1 PAS domain-containing protein [Tichowtungia aerotolerans]